MSVIEGRRKGTWRVTAFANGRQREKIVEGPKSLAKQVEARLLLAVGGRPKGKSPSFETFCAHHYGPSAQVHLGAKTWVHRAYQLGVLYRFFGSTRIDRFSSALVDRFASSMLEAGNVAGTVNCYLKVLRTMLRWGREHGFAIPDFKIGKLPEPEPRARAWTHDEIRRIYAAAQEVDPEMIPILHFLFDLGVRKGELIAAEWSWIDLERGILRIPVTKYWRPKNKRPREVPLSASLSQALATAPRGHARVFMTAYGNAFLTFPDKRFKAVLAAAKVDGHVHMTRHTFASHFLAAKPDLPLLGRLLGHSTTRTTELYAHMLPDYLDAARDVVQLAPPALDWGKRSSALTKREIEPESSADYGERLSSSRKQGDRS